MHVQNAYFGINRKLVFISASLQSQHRDLVLPWLQAKSC